MLKLKRLLVSVTTFTPLIAVTATDFTNHQSQNKLDNNVFKNDLGDNEKIANNFHISDEALLKDIKEKQVYGGKVTYSEYEGQTFYTDNDLDQYILSTQKVTPYLTSSNPNKIIKDYEHMILDEKKIYDADLNNFRQLYRDAFGNVAYSKQEALDTYTNLGLVKPEYSYDGFNWFSSPEEAKIHEKYNMKINKSLYYIFNNQYYNAFNDKDINRLLAKMDEGYYVNINKDLSGNIKRNPIQRTGNGKIIYDLLMNDLRRDFNGDYFDKVTKTNTSYKIAMASSGDRFITVFYGDGSSSQDFNTGSTAHLELANVNFKSAKEVINYVKNGNWDEGCEGSWSVGRCHKIRDINIIHNNKVTKATIELRVPYSYAGGKNKAPSINDFTFTDETEGFINLYSTTDRKDSHFVNATSKKAGVFSSNNITTEEKESFYKQWYEIYYNNVLTNFGLNNNKLVTFDDIKQQNYISNVNFDENKGAGFIYKDKAYDVNEGKGYSESLIQTYKNWLGKKEAILKNPIDKNGVNYYELRPDFLATKEQLDKFLYLQGSFNTKIMYSYSEETDCSDLDGKYLAQTLQEAKEKQLINNNKTLYKKYNAYDVFANRITSSSSEQDAVFQLQHHIQLTSKYVHKMEVDKWNPNVKRSWDLIISDGRYMVYRISNPNKSAEFIYFTSQQAALNAVKANARLASDVNKLEKDLYLYNYTDSTGNTTAFTFYNGEEDKVIEKIHQLY